MMKHILLASTILSLSVAAQATEINTDVGFDNPAAWMLDPATSNLWTVSGSKANGNGATAGAMLMQSSTAVKKGHRYRCSFTVSSYSAGAVRCTVGLTMSGTVTGSYVTAASITPVADTFTTALGLTTTTAKSSITGPGDEAGGTAEGAFRMVCSHAGFAPNDPVVYPGLWGRSHIHQFFGGTKAHDADATYAKMRTQGSTTCGDIHDLTRPINKTGYWAPAMMDGKGNLIEPSDMELYYKGAPLGSINGECAALSPTNDCRQVPAALTYTFGYNFTTHLGGPTDFTTNGNGADGWNMNYQCWAAWDSSVPTAPGATGTYQTIEAMRVAQDNGAAPAAVGCPTGDQMHLTIAFPTCWDGVYVDTPNHRDHMAYASAAATAYGHACDAGHPVVLPFVSVQYYYPIDAAFQAGTWHLASDEMIPGAVAGTTLHADYKEAWSPTIRPIFFQYCIQARNTCSSGDLGNGTGIKNGGNVTHTADQGNGLVRPRNTRYFPTAKVGMGADCKANGVCTVELIAPADGKFALMAYNGFVGSVDNLSLTEIKAVKGPVTVH